MWLKYKLFGLEVKVLVKGDELWGLGSILIFLKKLKFLKINFIQLKERELKKLNVFLNFK